MGFWNWAARKIHEKASRTSGILVTGMGTTKWTPHDYENFANETYLKNIIAFRCIDLIARSVASTPWGLYRNVGDDEAEKITDGEHPVNKILIRPNPSESFAFVMLSATAYLVMSGNSYFERVMLGTGRNIGQVRELYTLRPDRMSMQIDKESGTIEQYIYTVGVNKVHFEVDPVTGQSDILHMKLFHPTDDWYGAAITQPAAREIDTSNSATEWNKSLLDNEGRPGMTFISQEQLTDAQFKRLKEQLDNQYSGPKNAGRNLLLEGMNKAEPYAWSPKDMDFINGNREMSRRISYAYGVPPMLVGIPGDNTYSNYKEARLSFWEDTVFFYLMLFKGELNNWLFPETDEEYLDFDLDKIPALAPKREAVWERVRSADFLSYNEKRAAVGLGPYEPSDNPADQIFVNATMIPLDAAGITEQQQEEEIQEEEEQEVEELMAQGFTEKEAVGIVGAEFDDDVVGDNSD